MEDIEKQNNEKGEEVVNSNLAAIRAGKENSGK